jgi:hypothetical protein
VRDNRYCYAGRLYSSSEIPLWHSPPPLSLSLSLSLSFFHPPPPTAHPPMLDRYECQIGAPPYVGACTRVQGPKDPAIIVLASKLRPELFQIYLPSCDIGNIGANQIAMSAFGWRGVIWFGGGGGQRDTKGESVRLAKEIKYH